MKKISNVKLGINPNTMVVNVKADVEMIDKNDKDDLYLDVDCFKELYSAAEDIGLFGCVVQFP